MFHRGVLIWNGLQERIRPFIPTSWPDLTPSPLMNNNMTINAIIQGNPRSQFSMYLNEIKLRTPSYPGYPRAGYPWHPGGASPVYHWHGDPYDYSGSDPHSYPGRGPLRWNVSGGSCIEMDCVVEMKEIYLFQVAMNHMVEGLRPSCNPWRWKPSITPRAIYRQRTSLAKRLTWSSWSTGSLWTSWIMSRWLKS